MKTKITLLLLCLFLTPALTQASSRQGYFESALGSGLAMNPPVRYDLELSSQFFLTDAVSVGLAGDVYFRGPTRYGFTGFSRYHIDVPALPDLIPYIGAGVGGSVDTDGRGLLDVMLPELGVDYDLDEYLLVGFDLSSHLLSNFDTSDWDLRILLVKLTYRF